MIILYNSSLLDNDKPNLTISFIWQISIKINQKDQNKENVALYQQSLWYWYTYVLCVNESR